MKAATIFGLLLCLCLYCDSLDIVIDSGATRAVVVGRHQFNEEDLVHLSKGFLKSHAAKVSKISFFISREDVKHSLGPTSTEQTPDDWKRQYQPASYPMAETLVLGNYAIMRWRGLDLTLNAPRVIRAGKVEEPLVFTIKNSRAQIVHVDLRDTPSASFRTTFYLQTSASLDIPYAKSLFSALSERFNLDNFAMAVGNQPVFPEHLGYPIFNDLIPTIKESAFNSYLSLKRILCSSDDGAIR